MKKLITAISTTFLIIMIPALFVAYLYNNVPANNNVQYDKAKTIQKINYNDETSFKPDVYFTTKG